MPAGTDANSWAAEHFWLFSAVQEYLPKLKEQKLSRSRAKKAIWKKFFRIWGASSEEISKNSEVGLEPKLLLWGDTVGEQNQTERDPQGRS